MKNVTLITTLLLAVCIATYAGAASKSYTDSIVLKTTNWTDTLDLQKFDTSLGTLNSASVEYSGAMYGDVTLNNTDALEQTIQLVHTGKEEFTLPDLSKWSLDRTYNAEKLLNPDSSFTDTWNKSGNSTWTSASLSDFNGPGLFQIGVRASGTVDWGAAGGYSSTALLQAEAYAKVTYDYTPQAVPEGNTLIVLLPALTGLIGSTELRRRFIGRK